MILGCDKKDASTTTNSENIFRKRKDVVYSCSICKFSSKKVACMEYHCYNCKSKNGFRCFCCHRNFTSRSALRTHLYLHSTQRPMSCPRCNKTFCSITSLSSHLQSHFKKLYKRITMCNSCKEKFITRKQFYNHIDKCPVPEVTNNNNKNNNNNNNKSNCTNLNS